ncbi:FecR family protein [Flavobacteriaceae bacterium F89]|uniref:FecR family protein n=1 Tax=Cerina litoralis TaxID=2874477 RepID=A0AAE3EU82_9FLAO|nr:FecR family protein [Cerina litoralis]MCG2459866.1 FecR family protein [Cerina litoralis]
MQENYLAKWLNNELTEDELAIFKKSKEYETYRKIVEASDSLAGPDFDMANAQKRLDNKRQQKKGKVIALNPLKRYLRIAAAIALIFGASFFYYTNTLDETVTTQFAERANIILPDASKVLLNADSQVTYSEKSWNHKRNITLKGEAFFKVSKGERFTVTTDGGTVTVLGTQFNVENRKGFFEVSCYEGLVSVQFGQNEKKLPAGQALMVVDGQLRTFETIRRNKPSWLTGESNFKSIPLKFVLDEFQRIFNIEVSTKNLDLSQLFTGSFSNTDKELALQSISVPTGMKFKLKGNKVLFYAEEP